MSCNCFLYPNVFYSTVLESLEVEAPEMWAFNALGIKINTNQPMGWYYSKPLCNSVDF